MSRYSFYFSLFLLLIFSSYAELAVAHGEKAVTCTGRACSSTKIYEHHGCVVIENVGRTHAIEVSYYVSIGLSSTESYRRVSPGETVAVDNGREVCWDPQSVGRFISKYYYQVSGAELSDTFDPCSNSGSNYTAWIGGRKEDLLVISRAGRPVHEGTLHRIQDGGKLKCEADVFPRKDFLAVRYGRKRDILDVFLRRSGVKFTRKVFRIQDGNNHGVVVTSRSIGRLYGENRDVISLYGIGEGGLIGLLNGVRIKDGTNYSLVPLGDDIGVVYGRKKDVRGRFCFVDGAWRRRLGSRDGSFPESCDPPKAPTMRHQAPSVVFNCGPGTTRICP